MEDKMRQAFGKAGKPMPPITPSQPQTRPAYAQRSPVPAARPELAALKLESDYVDQAEQVMTRFVAYDSRNSFTTSKIRNILSMVSELYNELTLVSDETLPPAMMERIQYLRVRLVYESGREPIVKDFVRDARLVEYIRGIGSSRAAFLRYAHYMEALVAYHRFLGGKDK